MSQFTLIVRSLRAIKIDTIGRELYYVETAARDYGVTERSAARSSAMRAEIAALEAIDDATYDAEHRDTPLSQWSLRPHEIGPHARARGLEGRQWYEHFDGFPAAAPAGMGGYGWYRIGSDQRLTYDDVVPILGHELATLQQASRWAAEIKL